MRSIRGWLIAMCVVLAGCPLMKGGDPFATGNTNQSEQAQSEQAQGGEAPVQGLGQPGGAPLGAALTAGPEAPETLPPFGAVPAQGERVQPEGTYASVVVPTGWTHRWGTLGSEKVYVLAPNTGDKNEAVIIGVRPLSPQEQGMSMPQLMQAGAQELIGPGQALKGPEGFTVDGKRAGRIVQSTQTGQGVFTSYLAAVIAEDTAYVLLSNYAQTSGREPAIDGILASLKVTPPPVNHALMQQLGGCWRHSSYSGGGSGSGSSEATWVFQQDGSYSYKSYVSVSVPGMSSMSDPSEEVGRFKVVGNVMTTTDSQGASGSYDVRIDGGMLYLGTTRYLPCS